MLEIFNNSLAGIRVNTRKFEAHAQNIANVNTPGYQPVEAMTESSAAGGATVPQNAIGARNGVDITEEAVGMMSSERAIQANLAVIRSSNKTLGVLLDTVA